MATYNGNNLYLAIDGVSLGGYWKEIEVTPSVEEVDVTAGTGQVARERAAGLDDYEYSITIAYDDGLLAGYIQRLRPGIHLLEFGPEGNISGKPRHVQSVLITEAPFSVSVEKTEVVFNLAAAGAATPTANLFAGAVYP